MGSHELHLGVREPGGELIGEDPDLLSSVREGPRTPAETRHCGTPVSTDGIERREEQERKIRSLTTLLRGPFGFEHFVLRR
jgi:hypothetical protein